MNFGTDDLLASMGLKYEDLKAAERETFNRKLKELEKSEITLSSWKEHISQMKTSIELEMSKLSEEDLDDKQVRARMKYLLARLKNYILMEAYMQTPERAKEQFKIQLSSLK